MFRYEAPYRTSRGYYHCKVYSPETKRRTTRSTKKKTQHEAMAEVQRWRDFDEFPTWTLDAAFGYYLRDLQARCSSGHAMRSELYFSRTDRKLRDKLVGDVTPLDMSTHMRARAEAVMLSTAQKELKVFKAFWNWVVQNGLTRLNPLRNFRIKVPVREPRVLTSDEEERLLKEAFYGRHPKWVYPWMEVTIASGLRIQTSLSINRRHFKIGQERSHWYIPGDLMKGGRRLNVPMTKRCSRALDWWLEESEPGEDDRLFPVTVRYTQGVFAKVAAAAGISDITPHAMRRTFITNLIRAGGNMKLVGKLVGTSSVKVLTQYYQEVAVRDMDILIDKFDEYTLPAKDVTPKIGAVLATNEPEWRRFPKGERRDAIIVMDNGLYELKKAAEKNTYKTKRRAIDVFQARFSSRPGSDLPSSLFFKRRRGDRSRPDWGEGAGNTSEAQARP